MAAAVPRKGVPWTNCRLLVVNPERESDVDSDLPQGVVGRLYFSPASHPAVRQSFQSLSVRKLSLPALAVQNLVNKRGPDGLVGCIPGETKHRPQLLELCRACHDASDVLVCSIPAADVVLVPRIPAAALRDSLYFIAYATSVRAVELCERLRLERRVAVVLDIDNTLVDATPLALPQKLWDALHWVHTSVSASSGRRVPAQYAGLPGAGTDPQQDGQFAIHWRAGAAACTFQVRVRRGWEAFRRFLLAGSDRFLVYVCSKGKLEYVQLIWEALDPGGRLIPRDEWPHRINSTFPDTLARAANKTALTALGCAAPGQPLPPTQLAAPLVCVDDSAEAYEEHYADSLLYVEEFRPSDLVHADRGAVLQQVAAKLDEYWAATCTSSGTFAWQAAQSFATAILGAMQRVPMESPDALAYLQVRCAKQGQALWHQITVASVFNGQVYIADSEAGDGGEGEAHAALSTPPAPSTPVMVAAQSPMAPLLDRATVAGAQRMFLPAEDNGSSGAGGAAGDAGAAARTAEQLLHAALMSQC